MVQRVDPLPFPSHPYFRWRRTRLKHFHQIISLFEGLISYLFQKIISLYIWCFHKIVISICGIKGPFDKYSLKCFSRGRLWLEKNWGDIVTTEIGEAYAVHDEN